MRIISIKAMFGSHRAERAVLQAADQLVATCGDAAYTVAATMSWREDMGLIYAAEPGHWARVKDEVRRRFGWGKEEPELAFAEDLDRVRLCA